MVVLKEKETLLAKVPFRRSRLFHCYKSFPGLLAPNSIMTAALPYGHRRIPSGKVFVLKLQENLLVPHPVKRTKRSRGVSVHSRILDIACGSYASYAVDEAGKTWAWGLNNYGQVGLQGQVRFLIILVSMAPCSSSPHDYLHELWPRMHLAYRHCLWVTLPLSTRQVLGPF